VLAIASFTTGIILGLFFLAIFSKRAGQTAAVATGAALGLLLAVWLVVQGLLIGFRWPIQYVTAVNGLLIIVLALLPEVRRAYAD
jgi:putative Ca2+/H+ antiporter (TMEM165/GDT1 family)